jgi:Cd2+/Zn2+-exporting ATPase
MKKVFTISGRQPCSAARIENALSPLEGITDISAGADGRTFTVETGGDWPDGLGAQIGDAIRRCDPNTAVTEQRDEQSRRTMYLTGLSCADCAAKIEAAASRIAGVKSASVGFMSQELVLEAFDPAALPGIMRQAAVLAARIEPGLTVSYSKHTAEPSSSRRKRRLYWVAMTLGAALFTAALLIPAPAWLTLAFYIASYLLIGGQVVWRALKNIARGKVFDENFLMSLATISAFAIGEYPEGVAVMLFYQVGEAFQQAAVGRSKRSIFALRNIRPDTANLVTPEGTVTVSPETVGVGERILVRPGERIPLDGMVLEGVSSLDTSALTGESLPRDVEPGAAVLSGSINQSGLLTIEVTKEFGASTIARILELVQSAGSKKAPTERFITRFSRYYTPAVVTAALLLAVIPPLLVPGALFDDWLHRALVFLVVSCPCALVISIPLGFFGGIGGASRHGILVKGSSYLEAMSRVDTMVFDKTGTLTEGRFTVTHVEGGDDVLRYAAHAESHSNHPIALSIREAYGKDIDASAVTELAETAGHGISATVNGMRVLAGNAKLMQRHNIGVPDAGYVGTVAYVALNGHYAGYIVIADRVRPESAGAIRALKGLGVKNVVMLTGDSRAAAEKVADELGIDTVYAELLPHQKVEKLEALRRGLTGRGKLAFVGDGINDAPVLALADVGIAMGGGGADAAIEAADIVLMNDDPSKLVSLVRIARKTNRIVWQNILFALGVKGLILLLGAMGIATMWEAVFGDVGVAVLAILNAMRAMRVAK